MWAGRTTAHADASTTHRLANWSATMYCASPTPCTTLAPFACDLGYDGPPLAWDPVQRRHLRSHLDVLCSHLYGLSREDAYVLDTFPIVRRQDEAACGRYRTRDIILADIERPDHRRQRI